MHTSHDMTPEERIRYSRHFALPEFGVEGQEKLRGASVLIVGAGGLGSPLAMYLAAAGVGRIGVADFDRVDVSNLQRQILFETADVGGLKSEIAAERIEGVNPHVKAERHDQRLTSVNAREIVRRYDVVADGTDNFPTRYLLNDACVLERRPLVYGSIFRFEGQVSVFAIDEGPCYRCLFPMPPPPELVPSCAEGGVLGVLPGIVGSLQGLEVIKLLAGIGKPLAGELLVIDSLTTNFKTLAIPRDANCPVCGDHPSITELIDYEEFCSAAGHAVPTVDAASLNARMQDGAPVHLVDVREPYEREIVEIGGHHVPLGELEARLDELDAFRDGEVVVYCRTGQRSARAVRVLLDAGFPKAFNLEGGIYAWRDAVDPSIEVY